MPPNYNNERIRVYYFINKDGYVIVPPDAKHPLPIGFERREARSLAEVDLVTKRLNSQDKLMWDKLMAKDKEIMRDSRERIRGKLRQRMLATDCSNFEKRFIQGALAYFDRKDEEMYNYTLNGYFQAREYDSKKAKTEDYGKQLVMPKMSDRLASILSR